MNAEFYRQPLAALTQGDIFRDVPSLYIPDDRVTFGRRRQAQRTVGDIYDLSDENRAPAQAFNPLDDNMLANVQIAYGMVVTHSCELDNLSARATVDVALIRALAPIPEDAQANIRAGRNIRVMYLPSNDDPELPESYIDFSRLTSVRRSALPDGNRILGCTHGLLKSVYYGLMRYFTRFEAEELHIDVLVARALEDAEHRLGEA